MVEIRGGRCRGRQASSSPCACIACGSAFDLTGPTDLTLEWVRWALSEDTGNMIGGYRCDAAQADCVLEIQARTLGEQPLMLTAGRGRHTELMRNHHVCPKCEGTELWVIDPFRYAAYHGNTSEVLHVAAPVFQESQWRMQERIDVGKFEAWVCDGCGYTEWYASGFQKLASLAERPGSGVRLVRGQPQTHGYR